DLRGRGLRDPVVGEWRIGAGLIDGRNGAAGAAFDAVADRCAAVQHDVLARNAGDHASSRLPMTGLSAPMTSDPCPIEYARERGRRAHGVRRTARRRRWRSTTL